MKQPSKKLLYTKTDIANMVGVSLGVLRFACQHENVAFINWSDRKQMLTDAQVFDTIRAVRKRWTDQEIDQTIRNY